MSKYSCDDLGVCKGSKPACAGCTSHYNYPFAPGVIETGPKHPHAGLKRLAVDFAGSCLIFALVAFVMGCLL